MLQGDARTLLAGERVALNLLQHLSGIATRTHTCVSRVAGTRLVVRDTRKTVPGLRMLAKYAVRTGGGTNHRMGLDGARDGARPRAPARQAVARRVRPPVDGARLRRLGDVAVGIEAAEGSAATPGQVLAALEGDARTLLAGERLVLNLAAAPLRHRDADARVRRCRVAGTRLVVRDTRKTMPGMRLLAKYAVRVGGGTNHRLGLDDAILIKDNHLALAGGDSPGRCAGARRVSARCRSRSSAGRWTRCAPRSRRSPI